tara:strand:+ start:336 stop:491 length:156 start_codon:yes stop_codon:yes gene_type:complete
MTNPKASILICEWLSDGRLDNPPDKRIKIILLVNEMLQQWQKLCVVIVTKC